MLVVGLLMLDTKEPSQLSRIGQGMFNAGPAASADPFFLRIGSVDKPAFHPILQNVPAAFACCECGRLWEDFHAR